MYTFVIDDLANIMEPRGATRLRVDELLTEGVGSDSFEGRAADSVAAKDALFGGATY